MKMKTRELKGAALHWAVCSAEGLGTASLATLAQRYSQEPSGPASWGEVGPLISKHLIELHTNTGDQYGDHERWYAVVPTSASGSRGAMGPTPLIAAMRALVFAKLGEEIDLPEGLK